MFPELVFPGFVFPGFVFLEFVFPGFVLLGFVFPGLESIEVSLEQFLLRNARRAVSVCPSVAAAK